MTEYYNVDSTAQKILAFNASKQAIELLGNKEDLKFPITMVNVKIGARENIFSRQSDYLATYSWFSNTLEACSSKVYRQFNQ